MYVIVASHTADKCQNDRKSTSERPLKWLAVLALQASGNILPISFHSEYVSLPLTTVI